MRRKRSPTNNLAVSLFPFLAVLICTIGVLIIMLVMAVKSSHDRATGAQQEYEATVAGKKEKLLDDLDLQQFRVREYEGMRPALQDRLAVQRSRRSHIEESTRRLIDQAKNLEDAWKRTENAATSAVDSQNGIAKKIENLESQLNLSKDDLSALRQQVAGRPVLYSIVPSNSAGGTARRPIYVECHPDGIVLQPTGLKISLDDFTLPIIAGNPLDAALLATREHWKRYDVVGEAGDPYPLLVIRPGGAPAYAIARRAMTSWDDEFGYELLDSRIEIDWGAADRELATILRQTILDAQNRQRQMVATRQVHWLGPEPSAGERSRTGPTGGAGSSAVAGSETPFGNGQSTDFTQTQNGNGSSGAESQLEQDEFLQNNLRNGGGTSEREEASAGHGLAGVKGSQATIKQTSPNTQGTSQESGNANLTASGPNGGANAASTMTIRPLAESRGENWALPTRTPGATAYRRPIRIDCTENSFVVHSSDPARKSVTVPISGSFDDSSIDALIQQIWTQIEDWGMAEAGGFWKPVLRLSANEKSYTRAAELERKLDGSGLEIERLWR